MYKCKHFKIEELVDPETFKERGEKAWELFDEKALRALDLLREGIGKPITINNWHSTPANSAVLPYKESGLRSPLTSTGSRFSQHKFGRGFDCKIGSMTGDQMRDYVRKNYKFLGITCIEVGTPTWLHFDTRNAQQEALLEVPFK